MVISEHTERPIEFRADGWRVRLAWLLALGYPLAIAGYLFLATRSDWGVLSLVTAVVFTVTWVCLLWGLLHRNRPVVRIAEEGVSSQSIFHFAASPPIPLDQVARAEQDRSGVALRLKSGSVLHVKAPELSRDSRRAVERELSARIGGEWPQRAE